MTTGLVAPPPPPTASAAASTSTGAAVTAAAVDAEVKRMAKKASFEDAVKRVTAMVVQLHKKQGQREGGTPDAEVLQKVLHAVNRAATLLKTRYTTVGFWRAGLALFQAAEALIAQAAPGGPPASGSADAAAAKQVKGHVDAALEMLRSHGEEGERDGAQPDLGARVRSQHTPYQFEGQLSVGGGGDAPPPPWATAEAVLHSLLLSAMHGQQPEESSGLREETRERENAEGRRRPNEASVSAPAAGSAAEAEAAAVAAAAAGTPEEGAQTGLSSPTQTRRNMGEVHATQEGSAALGESDATVPGEGDAATVRAIGSRTIRSEDGASGSPEEGTEAAADAAGQAQRAVEAVLQQLLGGGVAVGRLDVAAAVEGLLVPGLEEAIEASLQQSVPRSAPPAAKAEVARLPVVRLTADMVAYGGDYADVDMQGQGQRCSVCQEAWEVDDEAQVMPCKHRFHPLCLKPWLDEHNSCPECRYEMPTDDETYERRKEREREEAEEQKGARNAVEEGVYMYM